MFLTKHMLYVQIATIRQYLDISLRDYPLDICGLVSKIKNVTVNLEPFQTKGLCGICFVRETDHTIVLNSNRTRFARNFDMAHELIHLLLHGEDKQTIFQCSDKIPVVNPFLEYQANEGAAELLMPYQLIIPTVSNFLIRLKSSGESYLFDDINSFIIKELSELYSVTSSVVVNRLSNLSYEITQYINGTPVEDIDICSKTKQERGGALPITFFGVVSGMINLMG